LNIGYIYKITNKINNKCYIGQTSKHYEDRWNIHKNTSKNIKHKDYNYPLYKAFRKYGIDNFNFEVIEECNIDNLNEREIYWIDYYKATNSQSGYNQSLGGKGYRKLKLDELSIVKRYNEIQTIHKIAKEFNCSNATIREILLKHNCKILSAIEKSKINAYDTICFKNNIEIKRFNSINEAGEWIYNQGLSQSAHAAYNSIRISMLKDGQAYGFLWVLVDEYDEDIKKEFKNTQKENLKLSYNNEKITINKRCNLCGKLIYKKSNMCKSCSNKAKGFKFVKKREEYRGVTRDILKQEIRTTSFVELGKKYGVSDNAIRKWCKTYNLPYKKSDINSYSDEEWKDI
jgi:group I intron endonuclease